MQFYLPPKIIQAPARFTPWVQVSQIISDHKAIEVPESFVPSKGLEYLFNRRLTLWEALPVHQRKLVDHLADLENKIHNYQPVQNRFSSDLMRFTSNLEPQLAGLATALHKESPRFSDFMMEMGLAWFYKMSLMDRPELNLDQVDMFLERTHKDPAQTLLNVGHTADPVEHSRKATLLNHWIRHQKHSNTSFRFDLFEIKRSFDRVNWAHLDLNRLFAYSVSIKNANLKGTDLSQAELSGSTLDGIDALGANLAHARLEGTRVRKARFSHAVMDNVMARGADFTDADLTDVCLENGAFSGATLDRVFLGSTRTGYPLPVKIETGTYSYRKTLLYTDEEVIQPTSWREATLFNLKFKDSNLAHSHFEDTVFSNVSFKNTSFREMTLKNCEFNGNIVFEDCNFAGFSDYEGLIKASLKNKTAVTIKNPKGIGQALRDWLKNAGIKVIIYSTSDMPRMGHIRW